MDREKIVNKFLPLSLWVSCACFYTANAQAQSAKTNQNSDITPFAYLPFNMQSEMVTTTSTNGKKYPRPNVMLFIDDSGSMYLRVPEKNTNKDTCPSGSVKRIDNGVRYCVRQSDHQQLNNCAQGQLNPLHYFPSRQKYMPVCFGTSNGGKGFAITSGFDYLDDINKFPSRLDVVKRALAGQNGVLDKYKDNFNWSVSTLWGGTSNGFTNDYINVKQRVNAIVYGSNTPATGKYIDAVNQVIDGMQYACQKNFIIMLSDGDPNGEHNSKFTRRAMINGLDRAPLSYQYDKGGLQNGIAFFSQQLNTKDLKTSGKDIEGNDWNDSEFPSQTIKTYTIGFGEGLSVNGRRYLADAASPRNGQKVQSQGDIAQDMQNSYFYSALDVESVVNAFNDAAQDIAAAQQEADFQGNANFSFSAPAITGEADSKFPALGAVLSLNLKAWSSVLKFAKLDKDGKAEKDAKGEVSYLDADYASRQIVVNRGNGQNYIMNASSKDDADVFGFNGNYQDFQQFKQWLMRATGISDAEIEKSAESLPKEKRKVKSYRKRSDYAGDASRMMADVMGTPLLALGEKDKSGRAKYLVTAANDGMVYLFESKNDPQHPYALKANYLPAAMQRESKDDTDTVGKSIYRTAETGYGKTIKFDASKQDAQPHLYLNNGGIQWRTTSKDKQGNRATYLAGAMGQGGRGAYVLAIGGKDRNTTQTIGLEAGSDLANNLPLWETEKGQQNQLGYTYGTPQFAQVSTEAQVSTQSGVRQLLFLANGYKALEASVPHETQPTLYVYDALGQEMGSGAAAGTSTSQRGKQLTKIPVTGGSGGLSTPVLVDTDGDALADTAYAGDQGGNLYRFDLKGDPKTWSAHKIYEGNSNQPITAAPTVFHDKPHSRFVVLVGTGSDIYQQDKDSKELQLMLGIYDKPAAAPTNPITLGELQKRTLINEKESISKDGNAQRTRQINGSGGSASAKKGWYIELQANTNKDGERVVTKAQVLNKTVVFTSRTYSSTTSQQAKQPSLAAQQSQYTCKATSSTTTTTSEASSWLYAVDAVEGKNPEVGSAAFAEFDVPQGSETIAAIQLKGLASGVSLQSISSLKEEQMAIDPNGNFDSGADRNAGEKETRDNTCVESSDYTAAVVDDEGLKNVRIRAHVCERGERLIRINTREVYK